jgi:hypothetical protein
LAAEDVQASFIDEHLSWGALVVHPKMPGEPYDSEASTNLDLIDPKGIAVGLIGII